MSCIPLTQFSAVRRQSVASIHTKMCVPSRVRPANMERKQVAFNKRIHETKRGVMARNGSVMGGEEGVDVRQHFTDRRLATIDFSPSKHGWSGIHVPKRETLGLDMRCLLDNPCLENSNCFPNMGCF